MILRTLKLNNFRNFSEVELIPSKTTLLIGDNAQGKSNILEAIYFLATTKSPRAERDLQLIRQGESFCRVEGLVDNTEGTTGLRILLQPPQATQGEVSGALKKVLVNGVLRRVVDFLGHLTVIHFSPEDINLVSGPPSLRRWHLDLTLAQMDRSYKSALSQYSLALSSRNKILKRIKDGLSKVGELDFWTERILESGQIISEKRRHFFNFLNSQVVSLGGFRFIYSENELSRDRLRECLGREVAASVTLIGPHRDDFIFKLGERDLAYFGSRGEQRMAVLDLKLAELKFMTEQTHTPPVLLLDDIFSELDEEHKRYVTSLLGGQQTIISAVETEGVPLDKLGPVKTIKVEDGTLKNS